MSKRAFLVVAMLAAAAGGFFLFPAMVNPWSPVDDITAPPKVIDYTACCRQDQCDSGGKCDPDYCYEKTWLISCAKTFVTADCKHQGGCTKN